MDTLISNHGGLGTFGQPDRKARIQQAFAGDFNPLCRLTEPSDLVPRLRIQAAKLQSDRLINAIGATKDLHKTRALLRSNCHAIQASLSVVHFVSG